MRAVPIQPGHRLNVLLTEHDAAADRWTDQLPRLLEPQGVHAIRAADVDEAVRAIEAQPIHAAVVDLRLPLTPGVDNNAGNTKDKSSGGGLKLLRVIQRLDPAPPAVIVRGRRFDDRTDNRVLTEALKLDAFSVLDQPVELEQLLDTLRRLIQRYYGGHWPTPGTS